MPHARRRIISGNCYELCFRARSTLPFVAYQVIKLIVSSCLARTQRDNKVTLCHDIWEGSHAHLFLIAKDSQQCIKFYDELQKKITDSLKRLLGIEHLSIWEGHVTVAHIADKDAALDRISYFYANPAQDNLVETIDDFPGYSSWEIFNRFSQKSVRAKSVEVRPWIRLPSIPLAPDRVLTPKQDMALVQTIVESNKDNHKLVRYPNAWMKVFGVTEPEKVKELNQEILKRVREREKEAKSIRTKPVMGKAKMCYQPILKPHTPKKRDRKIYVITSINELRMRLIAEFKEFSEECRRCYHQMRLGNFNVRWPLGAFKPPIGPNANILPEPI